MTETPSADLAAVLAADRYAIKAAADGTPRTAAAAYAVGRIRLPRYVDAVEAILKLHRPSENEACCEGCEEVSGWEACIRWPCPTVAALSAALTPEEGK